MKKLVLALLLASAGQVFAGPLEDAAAAHQRNDYVTAVLLLRPMAEAGNASAQYNLGFLYDSGQGVPQDQRLAVFWYGKSADQGNSSAQFNLGVAYAKGEGVTKDNQQAYFWFLIASAEGGASVIASRDYVEARLTPKQRLAAQADARDWKPRLQ